MRRRDFLGRTLQLAGIGLGATLGACNEARAEIILAPGEVQPCALDPAFMGLGYEMSALVSGELGLGGHAPLVELIRGLGAHGVVRLGGIVADFSRYEPAGPSRAQPRDTVFSRRDLEALSELLAATRWQLICSVNFAQRSIEEAVRQVRDMTTVFGSRLLAVQLGNEVDQYGKGDPVFRPAPYLYEDYRKEYLAWRAAIEQAVPRTSFASPDVAVDIEWVEQAAAQADGDLRLLPVHYYRSPASVAAEPMLLERDPRLRSIIDRMRAASLSSGIPWRMVEANSFSEGGLSGTSDSIVGTLWLLDFVAQLASGGASGVNIQTGVNQLGFVSWYSPLRWENGRVVPAAPYLGLRAFALAMEGCDAVAEMSVGRVPPGISAYAFLARSAIRSVLVVNRSGADVDVSFGDGWRAGWRVVRLIAPDVYDPLDATLGGARVAPDGRWAATAVEVQTTGTSTVQRRSAAVLLI